jgi:hypothetical protein
MNSRTVITLGYYTIRSKQRTLFTNTYQNTEEDKKRLFEDLFLQNGTTYTTKKSKFILADVEHHGNCYYGKFAKCRNRKVPLKNGIHIDDKYQPEYPYSYFVCDTGKNIFCIERKSSVYKITESIIGILSAMVTEKIKNEGYVCVFDAVTQKRAFWNIIKDAKKIYYLKLTINSPNILHANETAREFAQAIHDEFNSTTTEIEFRNDNGELIIKENDNNKDIVEYTEEAGGKWEVRYDDKKVKSSDKVFSFKRIVINIRDVAEDIVTQANSYLHR